MEKDRDRVEPRLSDTFTLPSDDGVKLHVRAWLPAEETPRAVVCIVHGMGEHGGRYAPVAESLCQAAGAVVYAVDQRGHGRSGGKRGHSPSIERLALDVARFVGMAGSRHPGLPVFLYGHSMGGGVALSSALRYRPAIAGLVLTSPWLRLAFDPPRAKLALGRVAAALWPSLLQRTGVDSPVLYRNAEQRDLDEQDDLRHGVISAAMFFALRDEGERSLRMAKEELRVPLLLLHGTGDRVTSFAASRELAESLGERCEFIPFQDGWHELHYDLERQEALERIGRWIDGRIAGNT